MSAEHNSVNVDPVATAAAPQWRTTKRKHALRAAKSTTAASSPAASTDVPTVAAGPIASESSPTVAHPPILPPPLSRDDALLEAIYAASGCAEDDRARRRAALGSTSGMAAGCGRDVITYFRTRGRLLSSLEQLAISEDKLPDLFGREEFIFSPLFSPAMIDACAQRGIFPMTVGVGMGITMFGAKLHVERSIVDLTGAVFGSPDASSNNSGNRAAPSIGAASVGSARGGVLMPPPLRIPAGSRKTAGKYVAVVDGMWDECVALIRKQHGENWLTRQLGANFLEMFVSPPGTYATRLTCLAIVDADLAAQCVSSGRAVSEAVAAGELGYVVGDVYTSLTGGYSQDGAGAVQLATLAALLRLGGFSVWDLGMQMPYKERDLGSRVVPRRRWLSLLASRRTLGGVTTAAAATAGADPTGWTRTTTKATAAAAAGEGGALSLTSGVVAAKGRPNTAIRCREIIDIALRTPERGDQSPIA